MDKYGKVTLIFGGVLVFLALLPMNVPGPDTWLKDWTTWLATYVGLVVAARSVWNIMDALAFRIRGASSERQVE